jgi:hypothetical protein
MRLVFRWWLCAALIVAVPALASASSLLVTVPGTSDPWLAGMPNGTMENWADAAPGQSPVLVQGLNLSTTHRLWLLAAGAVSNSPNPPLMPPDGDSNRAPGHHAASNGIAGITGQWNCLLGVFLDDRVPTEWPIPDDFVFNMADPSSSPALKQVFFIGDGRTGGSPSAIQRINVPSGATRLFLGTMDEYQWSNNSGSFKVLICDDSTEATPVIPRTWGGLRRGYR